MQEQTLLLPCNPSKKGFALIITLSVLSVVIALTVVLLGYFNEVKNDADSTKALIQANVYYADILSEFKKGKGKGIFSLLYKKPVFLRSKDGRFSLQLSCSPLSAGVNINWLGLERDKKKYYLFDEAQGLFDFLVEQYHLEDGDRLLEMIRLEIGTGNKFIKEEQRRLIQKHGIISYKQLSNIINRYEMESDDQKVALIPWHKYFSFSDKSEHIDAEYSSIELISYLFDIDIRTVSEWMYAKNKPSLETFVGENGIDYNSKKQLLAGSTFLGESRCSVGYDAGYRFTFDYIEGEAKYFEFHGKH